MLSLIPPKIELTFEEFDGLRQRDMFNCGFLVSAFCELYVVAANESGDDILATLMKQLSEYELAVYRFLTFTKLYMTNQRSRSKRIHVYTFHSVDFCCYVYDIDTMFSSLTRKCKRLSMRLNTTCSR